MKLTNYDLYQHWFETNQILTLIDTIETGDQRPTLILDPEGQSAKILGFINTLIEGLAEVNAENEKLKEITPTENE